MIQPTRRPEMAVPMWRMTMVRFKLLAVALALQTNSYAITQFASFATMNVGDLKQRIIQNSTSLLT